ncbi:MAG: hypothetical protein M3441_07375 [Chloroflexota bacterium]|nr:hypothetical protein [Chloroflexota bacterium]
MSQEEMTDEQLERLLREHFEEEYADTRQPAELWRALQPRLDRHNALDMLPPPHLLNTSGTPTSAKPYKQRSTVGDDWMPLPRGVKPTRVQRQSSFLPFALVACLVLGVVAAAYMLVRARDGQPGPFPLAGVPTSVQSAALITPTVVVPGTLIVEMASSDWRLQGNDRYDFEMRSDRRETYSGTSSAYLTLLPSNSSGDAYMLKMVNQPELAGKRVRFSAYVKAEAVEDHAELWLATSHNMPKFGRFDGNLNREIEGTREWERYEITQDVPPGSTSITFGLRLVGPGKVWIDAARLEEVGDDVPVLVTRKLTNGSFESLAGWETHGERGSVWLDTTVFQDGTSSLRLDGKGDTSSTDKKPPHVQQSIQLSGYAGKRVRVTAYVKTENAWRWATIYAGLEDRVDGDASLRLAHDDLYTRPIPATCNWTQYSMVMDVPQGNVVLTFGAFIDGGGTLWVDDVRIEEVGEEPASTGAQLQDRPTNLDFEAGLGAWLADGNYPAGFEIGLDDKDAHGGTASAYIKSTSNLTSDSDTARLEQWFDPSQFRNQRIRVSGYMRSDNISKNVLLRVVAHSGNARAANLAEIPTGTVRGRQTWQEYSLVVDVPRDSLYISVSMSLEGEGEVWFDDLKVEIVDKTVPLTGSPFFP